MSRGEKTLDKAPPVVHKGTESTRRKGTRITQITTDYAEEGEI